MRKHIVSVAAVYAAVVCGSAVVAGPALAEACVNAVCAESTDDGRTVNVYISNQLSGATHYNVVTPGSGQFETRSSRFSFRVRPGRKYTYSVQACKRGGMFSSSTCTKWARFSHTTD